jgi:hypothetical protein
MHYLLVVIRIVQNVMYGYDIWRACISPIILMIFITAVTKFLMYKLRNFGFHPSEQFIISRSVVEKKVQMHQHTIICSQVVTELTYDLLPILFLFLLLVILICNFGVFRMHNKVNFLTYLSFLLTSLITTMGLITLLPYGCKFSEDSEEFIRELKFRSRGTYARVICASLRPLTIQVGQFVSLNRNILLQYLESIVANTINILLMF